MLRRIRRFWTIAFLALSANALDATAPSVAAMLPAQPARPSYSEVIEVRPALFITADAGAARYAALVEAASRAHGVDSALVHAVIFAESSYDANAVSPAGASGLMQLSPETARRYGVRDVFNPADNIRGGVMHLKALLELFGGDVELAVAAYNAGENAVIRAGYRVPPYPETAKYVPKVIGQYRVLREHLL
jgi:soluble lytic murein transglycosylase-like protein